MMKKTKILALLAFILLSALPTNLFAWRGRGFGFGFGLGLGAGAFYRRGYYRPYAYGPYGPYGYYGYGYGPYAYAYGPYGAYGYW